MWLFTIVFARFEEFAELPPEIFKPVGLVCLLPAPVLNWLMTPPALAAFKWTLVAGLVLCAVGLRPYRVIAIPTLVLLTIEQGLARGFGHVNHGSIALLLIAWILAVFGRNHGMNSSRELQARSEPQAAFALQTMTFLLLLTYVFTGIHRLANSTPEIFLSGTMDRYLCYLAVSTPYFGMRYEHMLLESPLMLILLNVGFFFVTLVEVFSLFCLSSRPFRLFWLSVMVPFHLMTLIFMNIFFWQNLLLFPLLLCELSKLRLLTPSRNLLSTGNLQPSA
jgi:hypothetical protein